MTDIIINIDEPNDVDELKRRFGELLDSVDLTVHRGKRKHPDGVICVRTGMTNELFHDQHGGPRRFIIDQLLNVEDLVKHSVAQFPSASQIRLVWPPTFIGDCPQEDGKDWSEIWITYEPIY